MRKTPFHERTAPLNTPHLWHHWAGYVTVERYHHSATFEYFATRNAVSVFDTSPLFKYRIVGPDATELLSKALVREVEQCSPGMSQYTAWCDESGYVIEDGIVLRLGTDEYLLTSAEPNLGHFAGFGSGQVDVLDESDRYGILAVQGPLSRAVLAELSADAAELAYFGVTTAEIDGRHVVVSRTGFTGDLGYEIWVEADQALWLWDALFAAGAGHNIAPLGMQALKMARLDAGMLLIDVDFSSARFAWTDSQRETLDELGLGWMHRPANGREFAGSTALDRRRKADGNRWVTVGIALDPVAYDALYTSEGLNPPKAGVYQEGSLGLYDNDFNADAGARYLGYVTSFMFSPVLKRHIGIAKVPHTHAAAGSPMYLELTVAHRPQYLPAEVVARPFYDPARKKEDGRDEHV